VAPSAANGVAAAANNVGFGLGGETNGFKLAHNFNVANNNTSLSFKFQYITSDGTSSFIEYGYAKLTDIVNSNSIILFHARTTPTGNMLDHRAIHGGGGGQLSARVWRDQLGRYRL
jgi:hypothetical protein